MIRLSALLLWVLLVPGSVVAGVEKPELTAVIAALETPFRATTAANQQIRDFSADFVQLSAVAAIDRVQRGEGRVWFKFQPEESRQSSLPMFRWDYREPDEQQIISDGDTLWVYVPDNRQVIVSDVRQVQAQYGDNPAAFFSGLGNLAQNFQINWSENPNDESGHYRLLLTPRRESRFFKQIEVTVHQQAVAVWREQGKVATVFPLVATQVTDPQGNLTRITFVDARWNLGLADNEFAFAIPPGVEQVSPAADMPF